MMDHIIEGNKLLRENALELTQTINNFSNYTRLPIQKIVELPVPFPLVLVLAIA